MAFHRSGAAAALAAVLATAVAAEPSLPTDWHGVWEGRLTVYGPTGNVFTRPMTLQITPRRGAGGLTWRMTTEMSGQKNVRDYELIPEPGRPGRFRIDEKNGIRLNARLMGNVLYAYYKDGDILIGSRFERRGNGLLVELASVETRNPLTSVLRQDNIEIQSYRLGSVQVGELRKKP